LYTAVYWPAKGIAEYHWPGDVWRLKLGAPKQGQRRVKYPQGPAARSSA